MLSYYSFQRKSVKWWKKLFFHLFDLALVNAHILHRKKCTKKFRLHKFVEKVAEGLVSDVGREVTEQSRISSASRLVCRDHFAHRVPTASSKLKGCSQRTCKVCADRGNITPASPRRSTLPFTAESVT
jgi:maltodextrin utilization protein YvdJ